MSWRQGLNTQTLKEARSFPQLNSFGKSDPVPREAWFNLLDNNGKKNHYKIVLEVPVNE